MDLFYPLFSLSFVLGIFLSAIVWVIGFLITSAICLFFKQ